MTIICQIEPASCNAGLNDYTDIEVPEEYYEEENAQHCEDCIHWVPDDVFETTGVCSLDGSERRFDGWCF